jgi:4-amino-4-deoxy-L-arabinose transferase-like glycosyltransferase
MPEGRNGRTLFALSRQVLAVPAEEMSGGEAAQGGWTLLALLGIAALGAALRWFHLGAEPLYTDEAFSWGWAQLPHSVIWGYAASLEYNPPLFFSLQRLWLVFGDSEAALRSLPALFGVLTIPLVFWTARALGGSSVGLIAALLVASSTPLVAYSQEARTYSFLGFVTAAAVLGLVLFLRTWTDPHQWRVPENAGAGPPSVHACGLGLAAYATGTTLALYAHNTAVVLPLLANLVAAYWWFAHTGRSWRFAAVWMAANLAPFLLWLWWFPTLLAQAADPQALAHYKPVPVTRAVFEVTRLYSQWFLPREPLQIILPIPVLALLGVWAWRDRPPQLVLTLALAVGTPIVVYVMGLVIRPIWEERVLLWSLPFGLILIAAGIYAITNARLRALVLGAVLAAQAASLASFYLTARKEPADRLARDIAASFQPGDAVVVDAFGIRGPFAYYGPRTGVPRPYYYLLPPWPMPANYRLVESLLGGIAQVRGVAEMGTIAARYRRLWVVANRLELSSQAPVANAVQLLGRIVEQRAYEPHLQLSLVEVSPLPRIAHPTSVDLF